MLRNIVRILVGVVILALAVIVASVMTNMKSPPPKKERVDLDPLVDVIVLEHMTTSFEIHSQGTVRPRTETVLSAEVSGTIVSISPKFVAGGVFQSGEVLLRIDPTNYEVALEQADALVLQRTIEHDAQRNLERTSIRLPYEGMVRAKETDLGQFVNSGTRLGVVFATDYAEIRLPLADMDLAYVNLPGAAEIARSGAADGPAVTLSATQKGKPVEWSAKIVRTEGVVDEKSRVTYAVAHVADPYQLHGDGNSMPMGTFVAATIHGAVAENIIRVPRSVVRGSDELVFVDAENKLDIRNVQIVRSDADYAYLSDGAAPGDRVVITVLETAINGLKVRITEAGN